jgi:hypothetical protein
VQVWRHVAEAGEVDFVGIQRRSERCLDAKHGAHEPRTGCFVEIGHLANMLSPYHPTKTWIRHPLVATDGDDAEFSVFEQQHAAWLRAQFAALLVRRMIHAHCNGAGFMLAGAVPALLMTEGAAPFAFISHNVSVPLGWRQTTS